MGRKTHCFHFTGPVWSYSIAHSPMMGQAKCCFCGAFGQMTVSYGERRAKGHGPHHTESVVVNTEITTDVRHCKRGKGSRMSERATQARELLERARKISPSGMHTLEEQAEFSRLFADIDAYLALPPSEEPLPHHGPEHDPAH